jgi:hypothetical protein
MAKRFSFYYLQVNSGRSWATLEQSESVTVLTSGLADQLASPTDAEIRIVGANFDETSERWAYEQLFYIDQSSIDLGISEEVEDEDQGGATHLDPGSLRGRDEDWKAPSDTLADEYPEEVAAPRREHEAINTVDEISKPDEATPALSAAEDSAPPWGSFEADTDDADTSASTVDDEPLEEPMPWLRGRASDDDTALDEPEPFRFDTTPPRRRTSVGKIIGFVFVFLFLAAWVVIGALVYLQHPYLLDAADKLGIGEYLRLSSHSETADMETHAEGKSEADAMPKVEPLTTGQVVRFAGVAPALHGRWSPRKCETTFIEFDEDGYNRSIDGQAAAGKTEISETLQDDFVFYLRRSPDLVEHYRKVTDNDIQLAGATTESGFLGSSGKVEIYSRCP